jgi:2-keto-myo-inositol isomerase
MKLAFHGATSMNADLQTDIRVSSEAGFQALELWASKVDTYLETHSVSDLKALLLEHSVAPMTFNSIEFIAFRGADFEQVKQRCRYLCELAQEIGCPSVAVIPSPTPAWDTPWETVVEAHVLALQELSDIATPFGIRLAFEFIGYAGISVRTPRGAMEIIEKTARDNIGMVIDVAHFTIGGGSLSELEQLNPKYIAAFHLDDVEDTCKEAYTDAKRLIPGLGVADLSGICSSLHKIGYNGPCSIELFRPEYWDWQPEKLARATLDAAVSVLSPHFKLEYNKVGS